MRKSIRVKITLILTSLMIATIFITWIINRTFLDDFYLRSKREMLGDVFEKVEDIYNSNEKYVYLTGENTEKMERLVSNYNVNITVYFNFANLYYNLIYPEPSNIGIRETMKRDSLLQEYLHPGSNAHIQDMELIFDKEHYAIFTLYDNQLEARYIDLIGDLGDGKLLIVRSNFESIEESIAIANKFWLILVC